MENKLLYANSGEPDRTSRFAASGLGLHCLPISHKLDARLKWVKLSLTSSNGYNNSCTVFVGQEKETVWRRL